MKKEDIKKLLESEQNVWVCPITKKKFDSSAKDDIQKHKDDLIHQAELKEREETIQKSINKLSKSFQSRDDFEKYIYNVSKIIGISPPLISIKNVDKNKTGSHLRLDMIEINFKPGSLNIFKKYSNLSISQEQGQYFVLLPVVTPFARDVYEWRQDLLKNPSKVKDGVYLEKIDKYHEKIQEIHQVRQEHAKIESDMQMIRERVLKTDEFVDMIAKPKRKVR